MQSKLIDAIEPSDNCSLSQFKKFGQKMSTVLAVKTIIVLTAIVLYKTLKMWK